MVRRAFGFGLGIAALGLSVFVTAAPGGGRRLPTPPCTATATRFARCSNRPPTSTPRRADGMTALHWAAMKNDADLAQTLLYAGANVRATTRIGGYTPLILAAREGYSVVMEPLLKSGADANAKTRERHDGVDAGGAIGQRRRGDAPARGRRRSSTRKNRFAG